MASFVRSSAAALLAVAGTLAALELGARVLVAAGHLHTPPAPGFEEPYWVGNREDFGVWRRPDSEFVHRGPCFEATYRTNDVGARDVARPRRADGHRVVVLGDSFAEGWGVDADARFSNRLEAATGVPHLNFAMAHFSPYQSYLVYRDLAKSFDHDAVLLTVLPVNDFVDLDYAWASGRQAGYLYRYRPYLVPDGEGGYARFDYREPVLLRFLRRGSTAWNALAAAWQRLSPAPEPEAPAGADSPQRVTSFFYDATEEQVHLLEHTIGLVADEAKGKQVAVVLIPALRDLRRRAFSGPDPLTPKLEAFGRARGIRVVSLLEPMASRTKRWSTYYFPCDYHFSPEGHAAAAEILRSSLDGWPASGGATPE